jgi:hypothetical protein
MGTMMEKPLGMRKSNTGTAEAIRQQVLTLGEAIRAVAKVNVEEANRIAQLAEGITGVITKACDEFAAQTERLMDACAETEKIIKDAQESIIALAKTGDATKLPPPMRVPVKFDELERQIKKDQSL